LGQVFDLAIIGGGVNGCGIARDAAGRGNSVFLCEMNDLASAPRPGRPSWCMAACAISNITNSGWSRALIEREILWQIRPSYHPAAAFRLRTMRDCGRMAAAARLFL